jgi:hypothetical protein
MVEEGNGELLRMINGEESDRNTVGLSVEK